ncbi:MAG: bifunctional oligoribonuclease/PAP phosphatase NrnA [Candidatus Riflebacteria bacterium]|nr:bifunctional oligoribonuclease/PAP phosphatase NrnA [Candidatus Riflebacteria bacterium]
MPMPLIPAEFEELIKQAAEELNKAKTVFAIAHPFADGDALGSQLALWHFCEENDKECLCLNFDPIPEQISWLDGSEYCVDHLPEGKTFDLGFLMETTDASRMGDRVRFFERAAKTIHLDHHVKVKGLADLNILDEKASSTCEILYHVLRATGKPMSKAAAEALYVGIVTDTGNFRHKSTTPAAHHITGKLIEDFDLDTDEIYKKVYDSTNYQRVMLHGLSMSRCRLENDGKIIHSYLKLEDFEKLNANEAEADGAIRNYTNCKGVEVALLFKEVEGGKVKISFRSTGNINVMQIAKKYSGGGHVLAAGATAEGSVESVTKDVIAACCEALKEYEGNSGRS